jgi:hypothetical protein
MSKNRGKNLKFDSDSWGENKRRIKMDENRINFFPLRFDSKKNLLHLKFKSSFVGAEKDDFFPTALYILSLN